MIDVKRNADSLFNKHVDILENYSDITHRRSIVHKP